MLDWLEREYLLLVLELSWGYLCQRLCGIEGLQHSTALGIIPQPALVVGCSVPSEWPKVTPTALYKAAPRVRGAGPLEGRGGGL